MVVRAEARSADVHALDLPEGATVRDAVVAAGLGDRIEPQGGVAVWNHLATPETPLRDGDRVELLRPLRVDPKLARQRRVEVQRRGANRGTRR